MSQEKQVDKTRFVEKIAIWFVWLVVIGGGLLGIGMMLLHEFGPHG